MKALIDLTLFVSMVCLLVVYTTVLIAAMGSLVVPHVFDLGPACVEGAP